MKNSGLASCIAVSCLLAAPISADAGDEFKGEVRDAWLEGKIETTFMLNEHINPFKIDVEVRDGNAYLAGLVESDVDRDLAAELALAVDGISGIENEIRVKDEASLLEFSDDEGNDKPARQRSFAQVVDDATTTAAVKAQLALNGNLKATDINIDTENDVVILSGTVSSEAEKELAASIALNASDTKEVRNELTIRSDS